MVVLGILCSEDQAVTERLHPLVEELLAIQVDTQLDEIHQEIAVLQEDIQPNALKLNLVGKTVLVAIIKRKHIGIMETCGN
ncbi:hypothetical protein QE429_002463 [Bacillus sp. SORGH_AS 510]|uniref:hypothetical protein n=1 Tax=Bacillus sp. SORGH_AS_0510 TaxID=3041771 RepID=UPI00278B50DF|nr:hypothetical protein [Bacillus sp. SORGH_AS_0510]MDQ1145636.1 hypothetical protein [Bacillus sp. SORGH_AS_0510]